MSVALGCARKRQVPLERTASMSRLIKIYVAVALAAGPFAAGCDNSAADAQRQATEAQKKANVEITNANVEANRKASEAQSEADKKIAIAEANFATTREDYRHQKQSDLDALNKQLEDLDAKAKTATGKVKAELRATVPALRAQRDAFVADFHLLATPNAGTWDATRARLDKEWADLRAAVDKAE
jgi:hypothetical protein